MSEATTAWRPPGGTSVSAAVRPSRRAIHDRGHGSSASTVALPAAGTGTIGRPSRVAPSEPATLLARRERSTSSSTGRPRSSGDDRRLRPFHFPTNLPPPRPPVPRAPPMQFGTNPPAVCRRSSKRSSSPRCWPRIRVRSSGPTAGPRCTRKLLAIAEELMGRRVRRRVRGRFPMAANPLDRLAAGRLLSGALTRRGSHKLRRRASTTALSGTSP